MRNEILIQRLRTFKHNADVQGDVYLHQVLVQGKVMRENWMSRGSTVRRIELWIKQGYCKQELRVRDGSDRLCRLMFTTEMEG